MDAKVWIMLPLAIGGTAAIAAPRTLLDMNFDKERPAARAQMGAIHGPAGDARLPTVDKGTRADLDNGVVQSGCLSPPSCLRVSMAPTTPKAIKNKIMYHVWSHNKANPGGEAGRFSIGDGKPLRLQFAMKLGPRYDTPVHQMIHFQVFQPKGGPKGGKAVPGVNAGGAILTLRIVPKSRRVNKSPDVEEFIVAVRNPKAQNLKSFDRRDASVIYRGTLRKGVWNRFTFDLLSTRQGDTTGGRIQVGVNGRKVADYNGPWGFAPNIYDVSPNLGIDLGVYRSADKAGFQTAFFDNISVSR
jgi:hypothetical protein